MIRAVLLLLCFTIPASGAPIVGWQPYVNLTGFDPSYTYVPLNPDGTLKPDYAKALASVAPRGFRFMDWNQTVASPLVNWSDRPLSDFGPTGVSYETSIRTANQFHADPWFDLPDGATADFWTRFGALLAQNLDPTIPVVKIQRGNEYWNLGDQKQGTQLLFRARANPLLAQYSDTERGARQLAIETAPLLDKLLASYRAHGGKAQIQFVVDGFSPNQYWAFWQLDQYQKMGRNPATEWGARIAVANYVTGSPTDVQINPTDSPAVGEAKLKAFVDQNVAWDRNNLAMAKAFGLSGVDVYEARAGTSGGITTGDLLTWWMNFNKTPEARDLQHYFWAQIVGALGADSAVNIEGLYGIPYSQYGQFSLLDIDQLLTGSQSLFGTQDVIDYGTAPEPDARWALAVFAVVTWGGTRGPGRGVA